MRFTHKEVGELVTLESKRYGKVVLRIARAEGPVAGVRARHALKNPVNIDVLEQAVLIADDTPMSQTPVIGYDKTKGLDPGCCGMLLYTASNLAMVADIERVEYTHNRPAQEQIEADCRGRPPLS